MKTEQLTLQEVRELKQFLKDRRELNAAIAEAFGPSAVARPLPTERTLH